MHKQSRNESGADGGWSVFEAYIWDPKRQENIGSVLIDTVLEYIGSDIRRRQGLAQDIQICFVLAIELPRPELLKKTYRYGDEQRDSIHDG
jgi:hypothetical protein